MKILIIDDEKTIRKALGFALRRKGLRIIESENAVHALQMVTSHKFDLIIIDMRMPFLTGVEFIHKIRSKGIITQVLVLTSETMNDNILAAIESDKSLFVSKDLSVSEIIKKIDQILQEKTHTEVAS